MVAIVLLPAKDSSVNGPCDLMKIYEACFADGKPMTPGHLTLQNTLRVTSKAGLVIESDE